MNELYMPDEWAAAPPDVRPTEPQWQLIAMFEDRVTSEITRITTMEFCHGEQDSTVRLGDNYNPVRYLHTHRHGGLSLQQVAVKFADALAYDADIDPLMVLDSGVLDAGTFLAAAHRGRKVRTDDQGWTARENKRFTTNHGCRIERVASELGLRPQPSSKHCYYSDAFCPGSTHTLELDTDREFYRCTSCGTEGEPDDLRRRVSEYHDFYLTQADRDAERIAQVTQLPGLDLMAVVGRQNFTSDVASGTTTFGPGDRVPIDIDRTMTFADRAALIDGLAANRVEYEVRALGAVIAWYDSPYRWVVPELRDPDADGSGAPASDHLTARDYRDAVRAALTSSITTAEAAARQAERGPFRPWGV